MFPLFCNTIVIYAVIAKQLQKLSNVCKLVENMSGASILYKMSMLMHRRLKRWMVSFHGVSTKYLESYLGWMHILGTQKKLTADGLLKIIAEFREPIGSIHT